jgi:hypothetical protein
MPEHLTKHDLVLYALNRVLTIFTTVQIYYEVFGQTYCFLGNIFFMKVDSKDKRWASFQGPFLLGPRPTFIWEFPLLLPSQTKKASEYFFYAEHMHTITRSSAVPDFTITLSSEAGSPHRDFVDCE